MHKELQRQKQKESQDITLPKHNTEETIGTLFRCDIIFNAPH